MTVGSNGEQPPGGEQPPVVPPVPDKPKRVEDEERKTSLTRKIGYGLLVVAVLAALVPIVGLATDDPGAPARTAASGQTTTTKAAPTTTTKKPKATKKPTASKKAKASKSRKPPATAGEGPVINPNTNDRADSEKTRSKLVVGGIAFGLLVIVIWGRRVRTVRHKKMASQAKGK